MKIIWSFQPLLWCSLLALSTVGTARAQSADQPSDPQLKRFSISGYFGGTSGGPAAGIEAEMRTAGFDKTTQCWIFCEGAIHHPKSYGPGTSSMVALKYRLRPRLAVQLLYGGVSTGETIGAAGGTFGGLLILNHGVNTLAVVASLQEGPLVLGLGPALYMLRASDTHGEAGEATKLGLVFDAGLQFPPNSRFFFDLRAQYRWVGSARVGPYTASSFGDSAVLPEFSLNFSHAWFGVGFGVRF
jgi:hypothetical protein